MITNTQLLAIAKSQIGNTGGKYRKYVGEGGSWCDIFVYWLYNANGCGSLLNWTTKAQRINCPTSIQWCKSNLAQIPLYLAQPCDLIYYDWDKNGIPNHIGVVEAHDTTDAIYAIEGNTNDGKVARKHREGKYVCGVFRPHWAGTFKDKILSIDGDYGFQSVGATQKALKILGYYTGKVDTILGKNTVKAIQKLCGASPIDGAWGANTSGKLQQYLKAKGYYTGKVDKAFGKQSVIALQKWANANAYQQKPTPSTPVKSTNADKLVAKMKELAWAYGTNSKKWKYSTGAPKDACRKAMNKYGYKSKVNLSDCGNFVNTVVRSSGVDTSFKALGAVKSALPAVSSKFSVVYKGKAIPDSVLKAGDIIRYKKKSGQHAMFYFGDGKICDAGRKNRFANIRKNDHRYNKDNVKKSTIQVLRAK